MMRDNGLINNSPGLNHILVNGVDYNKGDKVKLKLGQHRSCAVDISMTERIATIEKIYTDYDDKIYLAVTIDDDPGQDIWRDITSTFFSH